MKKYAFAILIIVLIMFMGFSFMSCDSGNEDEEIYGCTYSQKKEQVRDVTISGTQYTIHITHYLLTIPFNQARSNITSNLGQPYEDGVGGIGWTSISENPPCIYIEVTPEFNEVRLLEKNIGAYEEGTLWYTN